MASDGYDSMSSLTGYSTSGSSNEKRFVYPKNSTSSISTSSGPNSIQSSNRSVGTNNSNASTSSGPNSIQSSVGSVASNSSGSTSSNGGRTTRYRKKSRRGGKSRKNNKSKRRRHHK